MRNILNNIVKFNWFVISNVLFPVIIFALFIILENSLLIQTNSTMITIDFTNFKGGQLAVNINTFFCNTITIAVVACVDILAFIKNFTGFNFKKMTINFKKDNLSFFCCEIDAYNSALGTSVSYLRI